jgi:cell division protein FtsB|tara:strand:- start:18818 stop:19021 length:204 start_codon:yes stop_codon:yes gene_type:complete
MDINVVEDLSILTNQIQQKIAELEQLNTRREQLAQEVHNLNGVAMYLRGKQQGEAGESPPDTDNEED